VNIEKVINLRSA